jgi:uncharacterized oxidoreductase
MPTISSSTLLDFATRILAAAGAPPDEAAIVGEALVRANLAGHDSHGVLRMEQYCRMIAQGTIVPGAPTAIENETAATAVVNGNWGFGQVVAQRAVELAIRKAREVGVSAVTMRAANHMGRLGDYPLMAAHEGMAAIATINNHGSGSLVAPWGAREGRLATNPICIATPGPERPIVMDITTSVVAEGKVRVSRNRGEPVPEGWIIDAEGRPTTDPNALYARPRGAILPFGGIVGHKGFGLSLMVDILSGALSGAGCSQANASRLGNAMFLTVIDIARFVPLEEFHAHVATLVDHVRSAKLAPGYEEILIPGEPEFREEQRRQRDGIPIDEESWRQLLRTAESLGVPAPAVSDG